MEAIASMIGHWVQEQGIGEAMLLFAVYWLNSQNKKAATEVKAALDAAAAERSARLDLMEVAVSALATRVNDCEKDRQGLWMQVVELAKNQGRNMANIDKLQH